MALPLNTGSVLSAAGFQADEDFVVSRDPPGNVTLTWRGAPEDEPSEEQIIAWSTDAEALPSGELYSEWFENHGGDPTLTARQQAEDALTSGAGTSDYNARAALLQSQDYTAQLAQLSVTTLIGVMASSGSFEELRQRVNSGEVPTTEPRTDAQVVQDAVAVIQAGRADPNGSVDPTAEDDPADG